MGSSAVASSSLCSSTPMAANLNRSSAPSNLSGSSAFLLSSLSDSAGGSTAGASAGVGGSLSSSAIEIVPSSRPSGCGPSSSSVGRPSGCSAAVAVPVPAGSPVMFQG